MITATRPSRRTSLKQIPFFGDGDTGYGNAVNVKRTVRGYAAAGAAGIMIEDQLAPKRCGHTRDKAVVDRGEALARVRAAVDAANEGGGDILIMARTDARATHGLDEALERCQLFREAGADLTFLEAPRTRDEMARYCREVDGPKMVNNLAGGLTPSLPLAELREMGFSLSAYPLDLLAASIVAQRAALEGLREGAERRDDALPFDEMQEAVGFGEYYREEARYKQ